MFPLLLLTFFVLFYVRAYLDINSMKLITNGIDYISDFW